MRTILSLIGFAAILATSGCVVHDRDDHHRGGYYGHREYERGHHYDHRDWDDRGYRDGRDYRY